MNGVPSRPGSTYATRTVPCDRATIVFPSVCRGEAARRIDLLDSGPQTRNPHISGCGEETYGTHQEQLERRASLWKALVGATRARRTARAVAISLPIRPIAAPSLLDIEALSGQDLVSWRPCRFGRTEASGSGLDPACCLAMRSHAVELALDPRRLSNEPIITAASGGYLKADRPDRDGQRNGDRWHSG